MRVLILVDAQFAFHERALIERVVVGLANEGVATLVVLPKDRGLEEHGFDLLVEPIWYADRGLSLTQNIRARQVARQVEGDASTGEAIDIVHVFGGSAWSMGRELARVLDAGVVFDIWRAGMTETAKGLGLEESERAVFLVPEQSFEAQLVNAGLANRVRVAPWGAHVPAGEVSILQENKTVSIVLMGSGRQKDQCVAAFDGIVDAIESNDDAMMFANLEVVERAGLWPRVISRGIEDRFTIIDRSEDRRDLLLRCDVMVYPDTLHEERTLLLDAMGAGMAIIAGNDEDISSIQESTGVQVVGRPHRKDWATKIVACLEHVDTSRQAGQASRDYVTSNHRVMTYITSVIDAYLGLNPQETARSSDVSG